jgi:hypothetical protein
MIYLSKIVLTAFLALSFVTNTCLGTEIVVQTALAVKSKINSSELKKDVRREWLKEYIQKAQGKSRSERIKLLTHRKFLKVLFGYFVKDLPSSAIPKIKPGKIASLFFIGGVLGYLGDRMHYLGGVLWYPDKTLWGQAWWVPLLFGSAALAVTYGHRMIRRLFGTVFSQTTLWVAIINGIFFFSAYAATAIFAAYPVLLTVGLTLLWIPTLMRSFSKTRLAYALLTALTGTFVEFALSKAGQFYYTDPDFLAVPMWLPVLYLWAANLGQAIARLPQFNSDSLENKSLRLIDQAA